jgi:hypothetical protein
MYSINANNFDEFERYQRGFGNRRALVTRLKHHDPKEFLFGYDNRDNFRDDKHLFSNPDETIEQNILIQQEKQEQQQQPPIIYR